MKLYLKFHGIRWKTFIAILLPSNDQSKLPRGKAECFHATVMQFFHFFPYLSDFHRPIFSLPLSLSTYLSLLSQVYMSFHDERCAGKFSIVQANSRQKSIKIFQRLNCLPFIHFEPNIPAFNSFSSHLQKHVIMLRSIEFENLYFYSNQNRNRREKIQIPR